MYYNREVTMRSPIIDHQFLGFFPPYTRVDPLDHPYQIPRGPLPNQGTALLWNLSAGELGPGSRAVSARPAGVALFVILPKSTELEGNDTLLQLMTRCRPHSVLPHMTEVDVEELTTILRRFPTQFALEVSDYLTWRGIEVDLDTRRLIRKTFELSAELRTVSALARSLYMSRRALGRRFMTRGLPVPSHWLHFGRVLRGSLQLQDRETSLFRVGCDLGYPDGFSFSNQMKRLTGLRPSTMRECFGWEWVVESWLRQEAEAGTLSAETTRRLFPGESLRRQTLGAVVSASSGPDATDPLRVAEERRRKE
jgi:AraC-like DNA-binding protein